MKKKIVLTITLGMLSIFGSFAFDWAAAGGWHRYTDYKNGYSGLAKSYYIGKTSDINPASFSSYLKSYVQNEGDYRITGIHSKLSKAEKFILLCELDTWDLENGDIYVVRIQTGFDIQVVIASVDRKGNIANWYCYNCQI